MSFANHNILDIALSIIPPTVVQIRKAIGVSVNDYAQAEASYGEWREVYGIVEPGGESNEHTHGIDFSKKHVRIWLRGVDLTGTHIQEAPDQIRYIGRIYNVTSVDDWFPYDNYRMCECVEALNIGQSQRGKPISSPTKTKPTSRRRKTIASKEPIIPPIEEVATPTIEVKDDVRQIDTTPTTSQTPPPLAQDAPPQVPTPSPNGETQPQKVVKKAMIRF